MSEIHKVSICLSDIPNERIQTAQNGKKYITIVTTEKRETDQYGKNATAYIEQTKEERESKANRIYIGSGWVTKFNENDAPISQQQKTEQIDSGGYVSDDLPF